MWCEVCSAATICSWRLMGVSASSYLLDSARLVFLSFPRGRFRRKATSTVVLSNLQSLDFTTGQMLREGNHANMSYIHGLNVLNMERSRLQRFQQVGATRSSSSWRTETFQRKTGDVIPPEFCVSASGPPSRWTWPRHLRIEKSGATRPPCSSRSTGASSDLQC